MKITYMLRVTMLIVVTAWSATPGSASATAALIFAGAGAVSYIGAAGLSAGSVGTAFGGANTSSVILASGATVIGIADPPAAIFFNGSFVQHYDPTLLQVANSGWLGAWGKDSTLAAPPVDETSWPQTGVPVILQSPNDGLMASILNDAQAGRQTVTFDWGPDGHAESSTDPFNFFATFFTVKTNSMLTFLGDAPNGAPPPGANFFVSTPGIFCSAPSALSTINMCGEPTTQYWRVAEIPEPRTYVMLLSGIGLLGLTLRRRKHAESMQA